jgi:enoyl-CoA hydratase/carnithine racemase
MAGTIRLEWRGPVAWIWIDHQEHRNAITASMWEALDTHLDAFHREPPRVVVVTGAGEKSFAAGADILEFDETKGTPEAARASFEAVDGVCRLLSRLPVPVIAALNGYVVGAGLELAVAADFRLAARHARLGITASRLGVTIGHGHMARLVSVVGPSRAVDLLMTGRLVTADDALSMGLVNQVVETAEAVRGAAGDLAELLMTRAPLSLAWAKQGVARVVAAPTLAGIEDDAGESIRCFETEDFREAVEAFREKRAPKFGRGVSGPDGTIDRQPLVGGDDDEAGAV